MTLLKLTHAFMLDTHTPLYMYWPSMSSNDYVALECYIVKVFISVSQLQSNYDGLHVLISIGKYCKPEALTCIWHHKAVYYCNMKEEKSSKFSQKKVKFS